MWNDKKKIEKASDLDDVSIWPSMQSVEETLNSYLYQFGVSKAWKIVGAMGFGPWPNTIPSPVEAVIFHFLFNKTYEKRREAEQQRLEAASVKYPKDLFFVRQPTRHGCLFFALLHIIANSKRITLESGMTQSFIESMKKFSPEQRGRLLDVTGNPTLTKRPLRCNQNFVAFINYDGVLYELDGCKTVPIPHGRTTAETLVRDVSKLSNGFFPRNPNDYRYSALVLGPRLTSKPEVKQTPLFVVANTLSA